ncbi:MAG TPA: alanine--tRNA ligase [bacterium]|nr:alanine--tRNA ligase [bacterium]
MKSEDIRKAFIDFWKEAPRNHKVIPNISLVPSTDSTLLFVNSGMFPLSPYLVGEPHPQGKRLVNFQRSLRTKADEIEEVGDNRHTLMFEMLGNWSLGDYFKKDQIAWCMELHVEKYGLDPSRLYVSVWAGDKNIPRDNQSIELWKKAFRKYGINAEYTDDITNIPKDLKSGKDFKYRIFPYGKSDNWWQRGEAPGELGGPSSEIFYDTGKTERKQEKYHINDDSGRFLEIGNIVFMEYKLNEKIEWEKLKQSNVDFGGGFERVVMSIQGKDDIFETDLFSDIIGKIEEISGKPYKDVNGENEWTRYFRILADHGRVATFILADGVVPSNKDQGYILRRFIRRLIRFGMKLEIEENFVKEIAVAVIKRMAKVYPHLKDNERTILNELEKEENKFRKTLIKGLKEVQKLTGKGDTIDGKKAFWLFETYGFPVEMTIEELKDTFEANDKGDFTEKDEQKLLEDFEEEKKKHQKLSRKGAEQKFKGGLADHSEKTTRLHTAHHLLLAALQQVLGKHVKQRGSNITKDRLRMDFSHADKMTNEELENAEAIVNDIIKKGYKVEKKTMPKAEAEKIGAEAEFGQEYGELVNVYFIADPNTGEAFSREFCGGPHVKNTSELWENLIRHTLMYRNHSSPFYQAALI